MQFRTEVEIPKADFEIQPAERMLFVGSCFADNLGKRFVENRFRATVNPFGVMYNPASILHTVERCLKGMDTSDTVEKSLKRIDSPDADDGKVFSKTPRVAVFTLGTNHVYILKETGEIVDNCMKRPQRLFEERELSVEECTEYLQKAIDLLKEAVQKETSAADDLKVIVTVSPIRYAKYGYHGSQLSKATLQLAADKLVKANPGVVSYFPAYEIMNDELRDYRFYKEDMLHPSDQAVEYIWERFRATYFGKAAAQFLEDWRPIKEALGHKPFNPDSEATKLFLAKTQEKKRLFEQKYGL